MMRIRQSQGSFSAARGEIGSRPGRGHRLPAARRRHRSVGRRPRPWQFPVGHNWAVWEDFLSRHAGDLWMEQLSGVVMLGPMDGDPQLN
ncbi:hypothetical protein [Oceanibacterium hippocampi]|uniref:Uncharacterized protein n=1 Tax=Oceanibacterium hippocampi TaxID=745714 RepID=A0A1Y5S3S6_9PROT|nr:hypothetical protein [Oceanibacterium hippocampi]SLN32009.1 hypothetical protein OCH7691_01168 [Oceanibacterium hippocampi]